MFFQKHQQNGNIRNKQIDGLFANWQYLPYHCKRNAHAVGLKAPGLHRATEKE